MHRLIYSVFAFVIFSSTILIGLSSDIDAADYLGDDYGNIDGEHTISVGLTTTTTATLDEQSAEIRVENLTESIVDNRTEIIIANITESIVENRTEVIAFFTEHSLNVNHSSSDITFHSYVNNSILILILNKHQLYLIHRNNRTILKAFQNGNLISSKQSNFVAIYDENTEDLWLINSNSQQKLNLLFKPKQILTFPLKPNLLIAETFDELHLSEDFGLNWRMIPDSANSVVLGWSSQTNSLCLYQHSQYIKLYNLNTHRLTSILTDVSSGKLFSKYLLAKRLTKDDSLSISHVNNLDNDGFHSLNQRIQSDGNFYCAIEDINSKNLLLTFIINENSGENNETNSTTCQLIGYSKRIPVRLTNISCSHISNGNSLECTNEQIPFYQVRDFDRSVYLINIGFQPTTMISYDGGINWNRTFYECEQTMVCPGNLSVVISSLESSNDAPGIVFGKVSNGTHEYFAVSSDGGRLWHINSLNSNSLLGLSNPSAVLVSVLPDSQQTLNHSFFYSTDYGLHWHEQTLPNDTSFQIRSLIADKTNLFDILILNNETQLNLITFDLNILINRECLRSQIKEWSFPIGCVNGSKSYYKRRISGSICLSKLSDIRREPCACTLADFQCLPGYKRSQDGLCRPKSQYTFAENCICNSDQTYATKTRGYAKSTYSQCTNGIETYLSQANLVRRHVYHPNVLIYGGSSHTKQTIAEIYTNEFDQDVADDDEDKLTSNPIWSIDNSYHVSALAFNDSGKQVYMAVEHEKKWIVYRISKNLREQNHSAKQLTFDSQNELLTSVDEHIEYLAVDWSTENVYLLTRNQQHSKQSIVIVNTRTRKRRTVIQNQQIQPAIIIIDPTKAELYWISHSSSNFMNIANLQGEIKKQFQLSHSNLSIDYLSYDPIAHELIYIINSTIYGLNTLDSTRIQTRIIYENSFPIENPLFISPIVYFTTRTVQTNANNLYVNAIDILARSYAKNLAYLHEFDSIKLFMDMIPSMPTPTIASPCAANPCSDLCIPLGNERFRCLCAEDARYLSCSCPKDEQYINGACQMKNGKCAPGRILCQNQQNCAESARLCEQDHTQYDELFKTTARCTIDNVNDGFDCYYSVNNLNSTCIPYEWFCDGHYDCPLGNDEEHCHKLTTTTPIMIETSTKCLTERRFTHAVCGSKCMKIKDMCRNLSNQNICFEQFHLHCKETLQRNEYVCKCTDGNQLCYAMTEQCSDYDSCERICKDSIHYAKKKASQFTKPSSLTWIILAAAILGLLLVAIIVMTIRYRRQRTNAQNASANSRTPAAPVVADSPPSDTCEKLLSNEANNNHAAN